MAADVSISALPNAGPLVGNELVPMTQDGDTVSATTTQLGAVLGIVTKTSNYTATNDDDVILCDAAAGALTITLPSAVTSTKKTKTLKKIDSSTNTVTITGAHTIDGASSVVLGYQFHTLVITTDGSNWIILPFSLVGNAFQVTRDSGTRGAGAVDLQFVRDFATEISSGIASVTAGRYNTASGLVSIAIGDGNTASGKYSFASNQNNEASGDCSHAEGSSTVASGTASHAEGISNTASGKYSHVGGSSSTASGDYSFSHGKSNTASGKYSTTLGGFSNTTSSIGSIVAGGANNTIVTSLGASHSYAAIVGGASNSISGSGGSSSGSVIVGGSLNSIISSRSVIVGGQSNTITSTANSFIGAGNQNKLSGPSGFIGGGERNESSSNNGFVGTGADNEVSGNCSFVGAGLGNVASGNYGFVGSGFYNVVSGANSFVGGGYNNTASAYNSTVGGGYRNTASGQASAVIGGGNNTASASYSTAIGCSAKAVLSGQVAIASHRDPFVVRAQQSQVTAYGQTTDNVPTEIFIDGPNNAAAELTVTTNGTYGFLIYVVARTVPNASESAMFKVEGCIDNNGGTVALVAAVTKTIIVRDVVTWDVTVTADNTAKKLKIVVTGSTSKTIHWVARIDLVEIVAAS